MHSEQSNQVAAYVIAMRPGPAQVGSEGRASKTKLKTSRRERSKSQERQELTYTMYSTNGRMAEFHRMFDS